MKNTFLLALIALLSVATAQAQLHRAFKHLEINRQQMPELISENGAMIRSHDKALVLKIGSHEKTTGNTTEEKAWNYVRGNWNRLGFKEKPETVLRHTHTQEFSSGRVVRFRQFYEGMPVDGNEIVVNLNTKDEVTIFLNNTIPLSKSL
jgi:Zn-dependent metalloprotease